MIQEDKNMLNITKTFDEQALTVALEGRLDTVTAPDLETALRDDLEDANTLTLDLEKLEYISSAGLRVLLSAHKKMLPRGGMKLVRVGAPIMEIFDVTGFSDILTIE
jgi:anti-sigma B factor antagonist